LFDKKVQLRDKIVINGQEFKVIGVWEAIGNSYDDRVIAMPEDTFREVFNKSEEVDFIYARVAAGIELKGVASDAERALRGHRDVKLGQEDFRIETPEELLESFGTILIIVQVVIVGIAGISLVVGGIGIANTMYTSVLERTKEVGIMKAIGARNNDILILFLLESGMIGLMGGIIGVILGAGLSFGAAAIGQNALLNAHFPWWLIVGALVFSFVIGTLFGTLPARQASMKKPVDSLRYE